MPYKLRIRQQPLQGRASGFAQTRDRRMIEPPLVLQTVFEDPETNAVISHGNDEIWSQLICHVSLWKEDGSCSASTLVHSSESKPKNKIIESMEEARKYPVEHLYEVLIGTTIVEGIQCKDMDSAVQSLFFVFGDLAVRIRGKFRIRCRLIHPQPDKFQTNVLDDVLTSPITIYSPKQYPGVLKPTPFSQHLWLAGAKITFRRDYGFIMERIQNDNPGTNSNNNNHATSLDSNADDNPDAGEESSRAETPATTAGPLEPLSSAPALAALPESPPET